MSVYYSAWSAWVVPPRWITGNIFHNLIFHIFFIRLVNQVKKINFNKLFNKLVQEINDFEEAHLVSFK